MLTFLISHSYSLEHTRILHNHAKNRRVNFPSPGRSLFGNWAEQNFFGIFSVGTSSPSPAAAAAAAATAAAKAATGATGCRTTRRRSPPPPSPEIGPNLGRGGRRRGSPQPRFRRCPPPPPPPLLRRAQKCWKSGRTRFFCPRFAG